MMRVSMCDLCVLWRGEEREPRREEKEAVLRTVAEEGEVRKRDEEEKETGEAREEGERAEEEIGRVRRGGVEVMRVRVVVWSSGVPEGVVVALLAVVLVAVVLVM